MRQHRCQDSHQATSKDRPSDYPAQIGTAAVLPSPCRRRNVAQLADDADQHEPAHVVEDGGAEEDGADAGLREVEAARGRGAVDDDEGGAQGGRAEGDADDEGF
jgi:hypothetical protein